MNDALEIHDKPVFSYPIASADMRYIEVGERDIYLRIDPQLGLVFRGEIAGCGPNCWIPLNEILLEYAMSCEGCKDDIFAANEVIRFGKHLADVLVETIFPSTSPLPPIETLSTLFGCILNSMDAKFLEHSHVNHLEFSLDCCPLHECAKNHGLNRSVEMAHLSFVALCKRLINEVSPNWQLMDPSEDKNHIPIHQIVVRENPDL